MSRDAKSKATCIRVCARALAPRVSHRVDACYPQATLFASVLPTCCFGVGVSTSTYPLQLGSKSHRKVCDHDTRHGTAKVLGAVVTPGLCRGV
eukprot:1860803-Amphidinium_carterae.1